MQQNNYQDYLKEQIEKRLYESFLVSNIPKSIYNKVIESFDLTKLIHAFYRCIRNKLLEHTIDNDGDHTITRKKARAILGRAYNIPRTMHICVLDEMERMNLVKCDGKQKVVVLQ